MIDTVTNIYNNTILNSTNNYPICYHTMTCDENNVPYIDPTIGPNLNTFNSISRIVNITFEYIYKNTANYPHKLNISNKKYITKKFYLENNKVIDVIVDMLVKNVITTTISGDTGLNKTLVKTTVMNSDKTVDTVYNIY